MTMEFKISHGTSNRYYLTVNNNPAPFAQLFENKSNSREKDPELVAACRLVKAAPKLLEALESAQALMPCPLYAQAIAEARGES